MKNSSGNVKFIRIRGKVVPIRVKNGSGSRGGRLEAQNNIKQKVGAGLIPVANMAGVFAFASPFLSKISRGWGKSNFEAMAKNLKTAQAIKRSGSANDLTAIKKVILKQFKEQKRHYNLSKFLGKKSTSLGALGVAAAVTVGSIALQISGQKQKARETMILNRGRK